MSTSLTVRPNRSGRTTIEFPLVRDFFTDMEELNDRIAQRAFNIFQERGFDGREWDDWFRAEAEILKPVPIEIRESRENYIVRAEVPGLDAKDLTIQAEPTSIYIHGKTEQRKEEKDGEQVTYSEVSAHELARRIDLPASINPEKASARLINGVLELTLPKAAPPRKLEIKVDKAA